MFIYICTHTHAHTHTHTYMVDLSKITYNDTKYAIKLVFFLLFACLLLNSYISQLNIT